MPHDEAEFAVGVELTVTAVISETPDAHSLVLAVPAGQEPKFAYRPGQFLTLRIPSDQVGAVGRAYSLSSAPATDESLKITVKRTRDGYASNWICTNVSAGDRLTVLPPAGRFLLEDVEDGATFFAGGSGITPVISMIKQALAEGTAQVALFYANTDAASTIFHDELTRLAQEYPQRFTVTWWFDDEHGRPTPSRVADTVSDVMRGLVFMCGPGPFMDTVAAGLASAGFPASQVRREVFSSLSGDPFALPSDADDASGAGDQSPDEAAEAVVRLGGTTFRFDWPRRSTLVDEMLRQGIEVPYSCRSGECGSCACTLLSGEVSMEKSEVLDEEDIADGYILGCQSRPVSTSVEIEF